jgi:hypothetical protein
MQAVVLVITPEQGWLNGVLKLSLNLEEILSRAEDTFEGRNKVLESSTSCY